jgi:tetratricopeptide (TPR) repeat protein
MRSGLIEICKRRPESAIERLLISLDLARDDPLAFNSLVGIGCAHFDAGRYLEASRWIEQAICEHPSGVWMYYVLCPTYALCGRKEQARRSLTHLDRLYPELTISHIIGGLAFFSQSFRDRMANALDDVGLAP